jgi:hypothetical protein
MERTWPRLERRLSGIRDRRLKYRGNGRRASDRDTHHANPDIPCSLCRIGLATTYAVTYEEGQRVTTYCCTLCGHLQHRVTPV